MTNLQQGAPVLSARSLRRLWVGAPAAALGLLTLLLVAAVLAPMWQALQRDSTRLRELEDLQVQVSLMRQQLRAQDTQQEKALQQREKLFRMIAGSGDVSTLLAVLDREARASGVQLDLYEPQAGGAPAPAQGAPPAAANPAKPAPTANPLETAGLKAQGMLISLSGPYPNLVSFLRRLESLNLLVIQSDLRLEAPAPSTDPRKPSTKAMTMKLSLQVYGQPDAVRAQAAAPGTAAAPGSPAQPAARPGSPPSPGAPTPGAPPGAPAAAGSSPAPGGANPSPPATTAPPSAAPTGR